MYCVSLRGELWTSAIGNPLRIDPDIFLMHFNKVKLLRLSRAGQCGDDLHSNKILLIGKEGSADMVDRDVPRTFATLSSKY